MAEPLLSILIPAYNGASWLPRTLASLPGSIESMPSEIIVVDNASSDRTAEICGNSPGVMLLRNSSNLGFSRAVNQAASRARGGVLVVVNQDLFPREGALRRLYDHLQGEPAVAGGCLLSHDGSYQPSCGPFPTLLSTLAGLAMPRSRRKYYWARPAGNGPVPVDWVTGAFMAFPRRVFDAVGGFDENFFMYYEDVDFCLRARQKGFPAHYVPSAEAVHDSPYAQRAGAPEWLRKEVRRSQVRYFDRHRPGWEAGCIGALNRAYFAARGWAWASPEARHDLI